MQRRSRPRWWAPHIRLSLYLVSMLLVHGRDVGMGNAAVVRWLSPAYHISLVNSSADYGVRGREETAG